MGMKGFIEIHCGKRKRLVNICQIETVEGDHEVTEIGVYSGSFIPCDESYDEIKRKIEEAQGLSWWQLGTWPEPMPMIHPNTEGDQLG